MRKILLFSVFLLTGLIVSQVLPNVSGPETYATARSVNSTLLYICLAFIMINVGREFELDKSQWRMYVKDYFVAMGTAALPWILVALYYIFVFLPPQYFSNGDAWKESLLLSRFAAPTSAGILFTMLAAIGLGASWIYRKIQVLAVFDDLDTILLMIPLQIMIVGLKLEMLGILLIVCVLLIFGWRNINRYTMEQKWWSILAYGIAIFVITWLVDHLFGIHVEILLPAFILGIVMRTRHIGSVSDKNVSTAISFIFMFLVGMSMPCFAGEAGALFTTGAAGGPSVLGSQPMMPWPTVIIHVLIVSLLSNIGKLVPVFFYRHRLLEERLALSVGMFTRGEVGAGIIFIAISYNIGGPALIISILTLAFNLILTGIFIVWVKKLALQAQHKLEARKREELPRTATDTFMTDQQPNY